MLGYLCPVGTPLLGVSSSGGETPTYRDTSPPHVRAAPSRPHGSHTPYQGPDSAALTGTVVSTGDPGRRQLQGQQSPWLPWAPTSWAVTLEPDASQLRMVLVGRIGFGKSATGKSILGWKTFESWLGAQPVTRRCQRETGSWDGRRILVVDTPPIFEAQAQTQDITGDVEHCYLLSAPGPHVLLLVTQLDHFTEQDVGAVRKVKEVFRLEAMRHVMVLFTHKEDLDSGSLEEYVAHMDNRSLRALVRECGGRCCGFNNRATRQKQVKQLSDLMDKVEQLRGPMGTFFHKGSHVSGIKAKIDLSWKSNSGT